MIDVERNSETVTSSPLPIFESVAEWRGFATQLKTHGKTIGFVPTMGALHEGHHSLVRQALHENDFVLVSIFVNPTQFNNKDDLKFYPRDLTGDVAGLAKILTAQTANPTTSTSAHIKRNHIGVFVPQAQEMYADQYRYQMTENKTSRILCGAYRPGHFDGVLTVVMKLLQIAQAERCYMGEKDYQQYFLVREMAENFFLPTEIIPCAIVREPSGLAMSSRNQRLSPEGRQKAALIYKFLKTLPTPEAVREALFTENFIVDYVADHWGRRFVAAYIENVRLIDNVEI